jgi:hypothetical protein
MSDIFYDIVRNLLIDTVYSLDHKFNTKITEEDIKTLVEQVKDKSYFQRKKKYFIEKKNGKIRCNARTWNDGKPGGRCSRNATNGSDFCKSHSSLKLPKWCSGCFKDYRENRYHNYQWEHFGRYNDPLPRCFTCRE